MKAIPVRVSSKYQIVIPKAVRDSLQLRPHDTLLFLIDGNSIILRARPTSFTAALRGLYKELWHDPDAWLEEERATWE
jgi:AbrB family looped-hinge helix DNA binding protein